MKKQKKNKNLPIIGNRSNKNKKTNNTGYSDWSSSNNFLKYSNVVIIIAHDMETFAIRGITPLLIKNKFKLTTNPSILKISNIKYIPAKRP